MKRKESYGPDFIIGKWQLDDIYRIDRPGKGELRCRYLGKNVPGITTWTFDKASGYSACMDGGRVYQTSYVYDHVLQELFIELHFLANTRARKSANKILYRTDIKSENEIWLYLLDDVPLKPKGFLIAYKLKRIE